MFIFVIILSFVASSLVRAWMTRTYSNWSTVQNQAGIDGHTAARHILDNNQLNNVTLEISEGMLSDHYIPSQKKMRLSQDASKRALEQLTKYNMVNEQEYAGAKSMLTAAALTYVAGAASSMAVVGLLAMRFLKK